MTARLYAPIAGILVLAVASSWGVSRWRHERPVLPTHPWSASADPAGIAEAVRLLESRPEYRGVFAATMLRGGSVASGGAVDLDLDPRDFVRARAGSRATPALLGLLPSVARGRIELDGAPVSESWRLACPEGCALDLLDRDPPGGAPSGGWTARPPACQATAWLALDPARLADPNLGGAGLAPLRERIEALERLLGRSIRAELAGALSGTGVIALEDRGKRGPRLLVALDLTRPDRVRELVDLVVSFAVVAGRGEVIHHRDVALGVIGPPRRGATVAVDGSVLLVSDETGGVIAAIERRRGGAPSSPGPPPGFAGFTGSWRAESASAFVRTEWESILRGGEPGAGGWASLKREGPWWVLEGEGVSPAVTADPVVPFLRGWLAAR